MIAFWVAVGFVAVLSIGAVLFGLPYLPTHRRDIKMIFDHLEVDERDLVVDLGFGDGSVLVEAAKRGAGVAGVEINPLLVVVARWRLRRSGFMKDIRVGNMFNYALPADTTRVFLFTNERFMEKLNAKLIEYARIHGNFEVVSYAFRFKDLESKERQKGPFFIYKF